MVITTFSICPHLRVCIISSNAFMDITTFQIQLNDAISAENGSLLAKLLHPANPHGKELVKTYRNHTVCETALLLLYMIYLRNYQPANLNRHKHGLQEPWGEISVQFVLVCVNVSKKKCGDAYNDHQTLVTFVITFLSYLLSLRYISLQLVLSVLYNNDRMDVACSFLHSQRSP